MRHKRNYKHLGRTAKHRKALFRNLATSLLTHERIETTETKAKLLRPWIEKLINRARHDKSHEAHRYAKSILFTGESINKLFREIAPRFHELDWSAGYTRVEPIGRRTPDSAKMAIIEILNNPIKQWEENQDQIEAEELGRDNFWKWELKILQQEQQYFKDHLDDLQDRIELEIETLIGQDQLDNHSSGNDVRKKVEDKYNAKKEFLLQGLRRALIEEGIHRKQEHSNQYARMDRKYAQTDRWDMRELHSDHKSMQN